MEKQNIFTQTGANSQQIQNQHNVHGDIQKINTVSGGQVAQNVNGDMVGGDKIININSHQPHTIIFEYSVNFQKLINVNDVYDSFLDYDSEKNIEVVVKCSNIDRTLLIAAKKFILEKINSLDFSKNISKSVILDKFGNLEMVVFGESKINKNGWETLKIIKALEKEFYQNFLECGDFDIGDLIDKYQDIDFSIDDKVYYDVREFLNHKIKEIKEILDFMKKKEIQSTQYQIVEYEEHINQMLKLINFYRIFEDKALHETFLNHIAILSSIKGTLDFDFVLNFFQEKGF